MPQKTEAPGCRSAAIATTFLLGFAAVFIATGLTLVGQATCQGLCSSLALTLLYAGGPISGLIAVFFGGVWVAWPLEITLWVVVGFLTARWAERRSSPVLRLAVVIVLIALVYGLVLSRLVEIAVPG